MLAFAFLIGCYATALFIALATNAILELLYRLDTLERDIAQLGDDADAAEDEIAETWQTLALHHEEIVRLQNRVALLEGMTTVPNP